MVAKRLFLAGFASVAANVGDDVSLVQQSVSKQADVMQPAEEGKFSQEWPGFAFNLPQIQMPTATPWKMTTDDDGPIMPVLARDVGSCPSEAYFASTLEFTWKMNAMRWQEQPELCEKLYDVSAKWLNATKGIKQPANNIFSRLCQRNSHPALIEPLAGVLRDPRYICNGQQREFREGKEFLVLADSSSVHASGKKIMFDAGGKMFKEGMRWFVDTYHRRGLELDEIYVWEPQGRGMVWYFRDTPRDVMKRWEKKIHFYNGKSVTSEPGSEHNVVENIWNTCRPNDFCVLTLADGNPELDQSLVNMLMASPEATKASLDEMFYEHRVNGTVARTLWKDNVISNSTIKDSYELFTSLRRLGVRAHSWV